MTEIKQKSKRKVIVIAGMRHSGPTALFNIVRLSLIKTGVEFISCYSEYGNCIETIRNVGAFGLIKTHEVRDDVLQIADVVLTTRRDHRDTVASAIRRDFPLLNKIGGIGEYTRYNRSLHED